LFHYHILDGLNIYLDDKTCNFPHSRIPFYADYIIKGGDKFYEMYENILTGNYFRPTEPPHFEDNIMDEQDENLYFDKLAQNLLEVRKEYQNIWKILKQKCWIKLKLNFLLTQLQNSPSFFNSFFRMNPCVMLETSFPPFKVQSTRYKWLSCQYCIFKFIRKITWNIKPKITIKEIWLDYLAYFFNKTFNSVWFSNNSNNDLKTGRIMINKMLNDLYFKFSSAFATTKL
jgi:hypothetical protein